MSIYCGSSKSIFMINGVKHRVREIKYDVLNASFAENAATKNSIVTLTAHSTVYVDKINVMDENGKTITLDSATAESRDGIKVWTIQFKVTQSESQTFFVIGYGKNGNTGVSASADLQVI